MAVGDVFGVLERLGFADVVLWMLSFAIVYGILKQTQTPKSRASQAIIAFVIAFFVLIGTPASFIQVIENISTAALVGMIGILMFLVFIEAGGVKRIIYYPEVNEEGKPTGRGKKSGEEKIFSSTLGRYSLIIGLIIVALLVFAGAGGFSVIGLQIPVVPLGAIFLAMIVLAIIWLVAE